MWFDKFVIRHFPKILSGAAKYSFATFRRGGCWESITTTISSCSCKFCANTKWNHKVVVLPKGFLPSPACKRIVKWAEQAKVLCITLYIEYCLDLNLLYSVNFQDSMSRFTHWSLPRKISLILFLLFLIWLWELYYISSSFTESNGVEWM